MKHSFKRTTIFIIVLFCSAAHAQTKYKAADTLLKAFITPLTRQCPVFGGIG